MARYRTRLQHSRKKSPERLGFEGENVRSSSPRYFTYNRSRLREPARDKSSWRMHRDRAASEPPLFSRMVSDLYRNFDVDDEGKAVQKRDHHERRFVNFEEPLPLSNLTNTKKLHNRKYPSASSVPSQSLYPSLPPNSHSTVKPSLSLSALSTPLVSDQRQSKSLTKRFADTIGLLNDSSYPKSNQRSKCVNDNSLYDSRADTLENTVYVYPDYQSEFGYDENPEMDELCLVSANTMRRNRARDRRQRFFKKMKRRLTPSRKMTSKKLLMNHFYDSGDNDDEFIYSDDGFLSGYESGNESVGYQVPKLTQNKSSEYTVGNLRLFDSSHQKPKSYNDATQNEFSHQGRQYLLNLNNEIVDTENENYQDNLQRQEISHLGESVRAVVLPDNTSFLTTLPDRYLPKTMRCGLRFLQGIPIEPSISNIFASTPHNPVNSIQIYNSPYKNDDKLAIINMEVPVGKIRENDITLKAPLAISFKDSGDFLSKYLLTNRSFHRDIFERIEEPLRSVFSAEGPMYSSNKFRYEPRYVRNDRNESEEWITKPDIKPRKEIAYRYEDDSFDVESALVPYRPRTENTTLLDSDALLQKPANSRYLLSGFTFSDNPKLGSEASSTMDRIKLKAALLAPTIEIRSRRKTKPKLLPIENEPSPPSYNALSIEDNDRQISNRRKAIRKAICKGRNDPHYFQ